MACNIFKRVLTLLNDTNITHELKKFYNFDFLARLCTDLFHILKHNCVLCSEETGKGLFHPNLAKFDNILRKNGKKVNLLVVEQLWRKFNKLHFLNISNKALFEMTLSRFQTYINDKIKTQLQSQGFKFIELSHFHCLRYLHLPPFTISQRPVQDDLQAIRTLSYHQVRCPFFDTKYDLTTYCMHITIEKNFANSN